MCGVCICDPIAEWDARNSQTNKCQISPCTDCHERQCGKLKSCAKCQRAGIEDCKSCNEHMMVKVVEFLTEEHKNSSLWNLCSNVKVEIGCQTSFVYRYNDTHDSVELIVAKDKDCAPSYICEYIQLVSPKLPLSVVVSVPLISQVRENYIEFN